MAGTETVVTCCSFCCTRSEDVTRMVGGPGVYICDECVGLCQQLLADPPLLPVGESSWEAGQSLEDVLASLPRIAAAGAQVERSLAGRVQAARRLGATWAAIGASLGMTRQSAWERFSDEE